MMLEKWKKLLSGLTDAKPHREIRYLNLTDGIYPLPSKIDTQAL